jgi:hypothetical protein
VEGEFAKREHIGLTEESRVDGNETFARGAKREAVEEAGVVVDEREMDLLCLELSYGRMRYILSTTAKSDQIKTFADKESNGARWTTVEEVVQIKNKKMQLANCFLRGNEPKKWFEFLSEGNVGYKLDGFVKQIIQPGTTGIEMGKRSVFESRVQGVVACQVEDRDLFVCTEQGHLPTFDFDLFKSNVEDCVSKESRIFPIQGVLCIQDTRNQDHELDVKIGYYSQISQDKKAQFHKFATRSEFLDPFDQHTITCALNKSIKPLGVVASED